MKKIAKIRIDFFSSDTYRAMMAKFGPCGALLVVRLQVMQQEGKLPDFADERQLLILAAEVATTPAQLTEMLATLQEWHTPENPDTPRKPKKPVHLPALRPSREKFLTLWLAALWGNALGKGRSVAGVPRLAFTPFRFLAKNFVTLRYETCFVCSFGGNASPLGLQ